MFLLHGEMATTCRLFIPIIVLRVHLRVFEAVAVSAMMHTPEGKTFQHVKETVEMLTPCVCNIISLK